MSIYIYIYIYVYMPLMVSAFVFSFVNLQRFDYKELFSFLTNKNIKIYYLYKRNIKVNY